MRTVRCLTVADTLSIGFEVRKWSQQPSAGRSKNISGVLTILDQAFGSLSYLGHVLGEGRHHYFTARFGDSQISRRPLDGFGVGKFGTM